MNFGFWEDGTTAYVQAAERMVERLGELVGLAPGARVIDAACGRGTQDLYLLARFGALSVDAIDVTRNNVALAMAQAAARVGPGELRFHHASATRLPFPDASFSHALCIEAAHHFDTREAYLREAFRVLVPGGRTRARRHRAAPAAADPDRARVGPRRDRAVARSRARTW